MKTKLTIDWHSKVWWVSLISILLVLIQQILKIFGIEMPPAMSGEVMDIVNSFLALGGLLGIIYDTGGNK